MRVAELMSTNVLTAPPDMTGDEAWELMKRRRVRHLVIRRGSEVVGVVSDRDVGGRNGAAVRAGVSVGALMTARVVTAPPDASIRQVANLMRGRTIGCLPVIERGRLVGIVTTADLLELLGRGVDRPARPERAALHFRAPHRKRHRGAAW